MYEKKRPFLAPGFAVALACLTSMLAQADPSFDLDAIFKGPLDAKTLKTSTAEGGVVVEEIEYTSQVFAGKPIRIFGILAYPEGASKKPAVFFGMPGMAPASKYWSTVFARKGYAALTVTLPKGKLPPAPAVGGKVVNDGNLTNFAIAQMRGITYLTQRPEVDADRIGIGGSSYGGFFATLIAGADPRVKAGMSFFAGGNHHLGSNLPMFLRQEGAAGADLWRQTVDPAWRLAKRSVPFLWGVAVNDHWFHFPAVVKTCEDAMGDNRLALVPHWAHGFPPNIDAQLLDWFDIHLAKPGEAGGPKPRAPYNKPGELDVQVQDGRLQAAWKWTGDNPVAKAELVVSYGPARPWHGWVYRYHGPLLAKTDGQSAAAEIPVPEVRTPIVVYGNITDANAVVTSTLPRLIVPADLGIAKATAKPVLNCYPLGEFSEADWKHLAGSAIQFGTPDQTVKHAGVQSIRLEPSKKRRSRKAVAKMKLLHVPEHSHRLSLWLRSDKPAKLSIRVQGVAPSHWGRAVVDQLRQRADKHAPPAPAKDKLPVYALDIDAGPQWRQFVVECPLTDVPVEGYDLTVTQKPDTAAVWWLDTVRFQPLWRD